MCEERERDTGRVPGVKRSEGTCICVEMFVPFTFVPLGLKVRILS